MKFALLPLMALFALSSCAWYRNLERSLVEDDQKQQKRSRHVPREQYDQLLVKYEELSKKYQELKENPNGEKSSLVDELQRSSGENFNNTVTSSETVDVFASPSAGAAIQVPADVESQLNLYRKGVDLKSSNPGEATKIFQQLEGQAAPAVQVRARYQMGELLYGKQQYDLSLQIFEDIINKYSSSGVVLDALRYAVLCSEKLGLTSKKDQYASMLNDVFEAQ